MFRQLDTWHYRNFPKIKYIWNIYVCIYKDKPTVYARVVNHDHIFIRHLVLIHTSCVWGHTCWSVHSERHNTKTLSQTVSNIQQKHKILVLNSISSSNEWSQSIQYPDCFFAAHCCQQSWCRHCAAVHLQKVTYQKMPYCVKGNSMEVFSWMALNRHSPFQRSYHHGNKLWCVWSSKQWSEIRWWNWAEGNTDWSES